MKFSNFLEATKHAKAKIAGIEKNSAPKERGEFADIDPVLFKYFFDLQSKVEKAAGTGKGMDYHLYARQMWEKLVGDINEQNEVPFHQFEDEMILGLHKINMEPLVYTHVVGNLALLVKQYAESMKNISLWSTGDVEATGYQVGKINSSKIIKDFHAALKTELPKGQAGEFMREKTSYFVADDKFKALAEYVEEVLNKNEGETMKIVIIEDSRKNFEKAKNVLEKTLGEKSSRTEIIPIWVTYSREGQKAKEEAESSGEESKFEEQKVGLNAIDTFEDLSDTERFGALFKDAYVFVDFDGVIGDNVAMREKQAFVTYSSLMKSALTGPGLTEQELVKEMKSRI